MSEVKADLIIKGSCLFDSIRDNTFAGFIAVSGNKISAVCRDLAELPEWIDAHTKVIYAGNRLVMPGFHDSHTHLILAGMSKACANLGAARSEEEAAQLLKAFDETHPEQSEGSEWLFGFNWYHVFWQVKALPHKETLDRYFTDRPVLLINSEAHGAWVNSKAMTIAGIDETTPDPFGGSIERDENGEATGFLYESAMSLVVKYAFVFSSDQEKMYLKQFMESAKTLGITSVVDVQPYFGRELGTLSVYKALEDAGELTIRITTAANLLGDLDQVAANNRLYHTDFIRANRVKQFVDGVFTTHTALMIEDYTDKPGHKGTPLFQLDAMADAVMAAHKRGLSVKMHAIGDRAVHLTLDYYERAIEKYGNNGCRHAIEHAELVTPEDIKRFGRLGVIPSVQPEHVGLMPSWAEEPYLEVLGEARAGETWAFKQLLTETGVLALGSDCPVVDNNPFLALHRGMTRVHDDGLPVGGWHPSEKLTLAELLKGYTYGSAYGVGREKEVGTLAAGQLADIVIVGGNLFEMAPEDIRKATVDITIMNGKIIYMR